MELSPLLVPEKRVRDPDLLLRLEAQSDLFQPISRVGSFPAWRSEGRNAVAGRATPAGSRCSPDNPEQNEWQVDHLNQYDYTNLENLVRIGTVQSF